MARNADRGTSALTTSNARQLRIIAVGTAALASAQTWHRGTKLEYDVKGLV